MLFTEKKRTNIGPVLAKAGIGIDCGGRTCIKREVALGMME
jgi:hypothetical protein